MKFALAALLFATCHSLGFGQGLEGRAALIGWGEAVQRASAVPAYKLTGTRVQEFNGPDGVKKSEARWVSLIDGPKYNVTWAAKGEPSHQQSFDGKLWYGVTQDKLRPAGIVVSHPITSVEASLDEHLAKQAAGLFYPRISDMVERPASFGGASLLEKYKGNDRFLKVTTTGDSVSLSLDEKKAYSLNLPQELTLTMKGDCFYPASLKTSEQANGVTTNYEVSITDYQPMGKSFFPKKIVESITQSTAKGSKRQLVTTTYTMDVKAASGLKPNDFVIKFAPGTALFDDRETGKGRVATVQSTGEAAKGYIPYVAIGLLVVIGGIVLAIQRRGRRPNG